MKHLNQQRLFEHYNPLEERIGSEFFDELPTGTGIYKMYGPKEELLYVGKAKNLRNRLFTYRRAKVGLVSRKTIRLIRKVHRIEYERCSDEKKALLLENELIRNRRPEFNRAKKSPETYYYIHFNTEEDNIFFRLDMTRQTEDGGWQTYGAFKGHRLVRRAMGSLLRLLFVAEHSLESVHGLPPVLLQNLTPMNYRLPFLGDTFSLDLSLLDALLKGDSEIFFEWITERFRDEGQIERYIGKLILEDLESVKNFFARCCRRNYEIVERLQLESHIIPQEKLDDYLIQVSL